MGKSTNRFKFESFACKIEKVGGERARFKLGTTRCDEETFFVEVLEKWIEEDRGAHFQAFVEDIPRKELSTYAQVLHYNKELFGALLKHLEIENSSCLQTLLELCMALARDLRDEFYQHMWPLFARIVVIMENAGQNVELLETTHLTMALLFKLHWKQIIHELRKTFDRFLPLFANERHHIRRFAAEAFAFLIRKSSAVEKFTKFMLEKAERIQNDHLYDGIAQLVFNSIYGMNKTFHSCMNEMLTSMLSALASCNYVLSREIFGKAVMLSSQHVSITCLESLCSILMRHLETRTNMTAFKEALFLFRIAIAPYKAGAYTGYNENLLKCFKTVLDESWFEIDEEFVAISTDVIKTNFVSEKYALGIRQFFESLCSTSLKEYNSQKSALLLSFVKRILHLDYFNMYIMPSVGKLSSITIRSRASVLITDEDIRALVNFYAELVTKYRPIQNVLDRDQRSPFFDISEHTALKDFIIRQLEQIQIASIARFIPLCIIWPWQYSGQEKPGGTEHILRTVLKLLEAPAGQLRSELFERAQAILILASSLYEADKQMLQQLDEASVRTFVKNHDCVESAIRFYELYVHVRKANSSLSDFDETTNLLSDAFYSPNSAIRLASLAICNSFKVQLTPQVAKQKPAGNAFLILAAAERQPLTPSGLRERLFKFRELLYGRHVYSLPQERVNQHEKLILRVSLAQFFEQFSLLWPGIHEILETFANGMNIDEFWPEVERVLNFALSGLRNDVPICTQTQFSQFIGTVDPIVRTDYGVFIEQLIKFLKKVPNIAERRTKLLSSIFLDFFNKDYMKAEKIRVDVDAELKSIVDDEETDDAKFSEIQLPASQEAQPVYILSKPRARKMLIAFLELFAAFKGPKVISQQQEIYKVYNELLLSWDTDLQRAALNCIFAYKFKWLNPYKEVLLGLLEKGTFRAELTKLAIGSENSIISKTHENDFVPLLLRVLYGRLAVPNSKFGHNHRIVIIRFLAGCQTEHLDSFVRLLLYPVTRVVDACSGDYEQVRASALQDAQLREKLRFKDIYIALEAVDHVLKGIPQVLSEEQRLLIFRLLISIVVLIQALAENSQDEDEIREIKAMRVVVMTRLRQFTLAFAHCRWSKEQFDALIRYIIVPNASLVTSADGRTLTVTISSVLGIIAAIAEMPRLFKLLVVKISIEHEVSCLLRLMVDSLLFEKTVDRYIAMVRGSLVKMLEYADESPEVIDGLDYFDIKYIEGLNLGTSVLLTQIDVVLEYIARTLTSNSRASTDGENLQILSGLAPFIETPDIARRFTSCLLQILERKTKSSKLEAIAAVLTTLGSIVRVVEDPADVYKHLPKLFLRLTDRAVREALGKVCEGLALNPRCLVVDSNTLRNICDIESWNTRMIAEPNFELRSTALASLSTMFRAGKQQPTIYLVSTIAQCLAHTLSTVDDIALRAQSSLCLRELIEFLPLPGYSPDEVTAVLNQQLLPLVVRGFKHEQEHVRDEFVRALHSLVVTFPDNTQIGQLSKVRNIQDPERDFFENAVHIQIGKRRAAFANLAEDIDAGRVEIDSSVLFAFFIPLLRHYMLNVNQKTSSISDAALQCLVAILKRAPWHPYINLLDRYIDQLAKDLEHEKAYIRIVCAILDAFHFEAQQSEKYEPMEVDQTSPDNEAESQEIIVVQPLKPEISPGKVFEKIINNILPKLKDAINGKLNPKAKDVHKLAMDAGQKHYQEDDDIRRAPITLAAVKLLIKMPEVTIKQNLHGIILKLVQLMVAKSDRVRETARKVMTQVVTTLGPKYFPFVVREMKHVMQRGYQVHVLIFTTHTLLGIMRNELKPGDLDSCLDVIIQLCCEDLFYSVSEEKEVDAIRAHIPEAKANRTMETIENVGRFVGLTSLRTVLKPIYEVIEKKPTAKAIKGVGELLRHMAIGVKDNESLDAHNLLIFCYQLLEEHVAKMSAVQDKNKAAEAESKGIVRPESCLIIPKDPRRTGEITKHSLKSRSHVFVEYALQILAFLLQNKRFESTSEEDIQRLDPFVPILAKCLALKYDKVTSLALRCVYPLLLFPLPTLHSNTRSLCERMFVILSDFAALGNAGNKHSVIELNRLLFKTFTGLIRISPAALLDAQHIELLLTYVITDIIDSAKQATAFSLIKTVISKGIQHPMIIEVVKLLREQAIVSEVPHVQTQCRAVIASFVGQHPQARPPDRELAWWLDQLSYEFEPGRLSAAEMINTFFANFSQEVLESLCLVAVVKLSSRFVNDSSPKCRKFCALALSTLLTNVGDGCKNAVFSSAVDWLDSDNEAHAAVGAGVLMQLAHVEAEKFERRITKALSMLSAKLAAEDALEKLTVNTILSVMEAITVCLRESKTPAHAVQRPVQLVLESLGKFCHCAQELEDIRQASSCLIGQIASMLSSTEISNLKSPSASELCGWMIFQLRASVISDATANQAVKNLAILVPALASSEFTEIVLRLVKAGLFEVRKHPDQAVRRLALFKLCAALFMRADEERLSTLVDCFMPLLAREMLRKSAKNKDALFTLANEVGDILKSKLGEAVYADELTKHTRSITEKAQARKQSKKEKLVADPGRAIEDRQKKYKRKTEARKRKLDELKPYRVTKRKHVEQLRAQLNDD